MLEGGADSGSWLADWEDTVVSKIRTRDDPFSLAEYALHLSRILAYPGLDVQGYLDRIEEVRNRVLAALKKSPTSPARPTFVIEKLNEQMFQVERFSPNTEDYYNPLNSYLNVVLEKKKGIPITLCVIYLRLANSVNLPMVPVSFPAHFLVKHVMQGENGEIIVDPFNGGRIMDDYSLKTLLEQSFPHQNIPLTKSFVEAATSAQVITRMLNNLKASYSEVSDIGRYERANEMILALDRYNPDAIRDRGVLLYKSGNATEALNSLNSYLEIDPEAADADEVLELIRQIRQELK